MDRLLLHAQGVWQLLGECRTTFYGPTGSYHDPDFPPPVRRPGRAPQWFRADVEAFAARVAERYRGVPPPAAPALPPRAHRHRGRPCMARPFESTQG